MGRHRVIQAIERGDKRIEVTVDRGHGPVQTTVDPKVLAREMGVTKESLAATDEQQSYRKGGLQPREAVTNGGSMVKKPQVQDIANEVERGLGGEPGIKQGVPMRDQFKSSGMVSEEPKLSSRPDKAVLQKAGANEADMTHILAQPNAALSKLALDNDVEISEAAPWVGRSLSHLARR